MNRIWQRQASERLFRSPEAQLFKYKRILDRLRSSGLSREEVNRRFRANKRRLEGFYAAAFCLGIQRMEGETIQFSMWEDGDHDFVYRIARNKGDCIPAQLKEFVPRSINEKATFQEILDRLPEYGKSPELCVVLYHAREGVKGPIGNPPENLCFRSIWLLGLVSNSPAKFALAGNFMLGEEHRGTVVFGLQHNQPLQRTSR